MHQWNKKAHFFVCKLTVFVNETFGDFAKVTLTQVEEFEKNVAQVESSPQHRFSTWLESSRITEIRDSSHATTHFFTHIPFVVNCTFNATRTDRLLQLHQGWWRSMNDDVIGRRKCTRFFATPNKIVLAATKNHISFALEKRKLENNVLCFINILDDGLRLSWNKE